MTHDRASDVTPAWTLDGRYVLFSSDRTGIANIYAYEIESGRLRQVTNVLTGAFMPEVSPDGRTLVYVGYTSTGFDLYSLQLAEKDFLDAPAAAVDRPEPSPEPAAQRWPVTPYRALETLLPRSYGFSYATGVFGKTLTVTAHGEDIVGLHTLDLSLGFYAGIDQVVASIDYAYHPLPFSLRVGGYRDFGRQAPLVTGGQTYPVLDESWGVTTGVDYVLPGQFDFQEVALSYTASSHSPSYATGGLNDPYSDVLARPSDTFLGSVRLAFHYQNAFQPLYGVSSERGVSLSLATDFGGPATGSDTTLAAVTGNATGYVPMPWLEHHAVALALSGGTAGGAFARGDFFHTGGFADTNRGFPYNAFSGRQYNLANVEYRFPIAWIERGPSTLPFFAHGVSGTLFADYGGAYNRIDSKDPLAQYHLGLGGELRVSMVLAYFIETGFRIGWAHGFGDLGGSQTYFVAAATF